MDLSLACWAVKSVMLLPPHKIVGVIYDLLGLNNALGNKKVSMSLANLSNIKQSLVKASAIGQFAGSFSCKTSITNRKILRIRHSVKVDSDMEHIG